MKENRLKKIKKLETYLVNGEYFFDIESRVFFLNAKKDSPILINRVVDESTYVSIHNENKKNFDGKILWFCSNGDIRVFSDSQTLTLCKSKTNYETKIENYDYFSNYFHLPKLLFKENKHLCIIEEFISSQPINHSNTHFILENIYSDYVNYFKQMVQSGNLITRSFIDFAQLDSKRHRLKQLDIIYDAIDNRLLNEPWPFIKLHGDLWTGNILLTTTESSNLVYIDWDESGSYIFFYDLFRFMWNELDVNERYDIYQCYLNGGFDAYFDAIFSLFHLSFDPTLKQDYFCLFILNYILHDSSTIPNQVKQQELADFIDKVLDLNN